MKKFLLFSCVALALVVGCSKNDAPETQKLTLDKETLTLLSSGTTSAQLTVTDPSYSSNPDLKWVSLDPSIASVNKTGLVMAKAPGSTVVYVYVNGSSAVRGECQVTVLPTDAKLKLTMDATEFNIGDTIKGKFAYGETPAIGSDVVLETSDTVGVRMVKAKLIYDLDKAGKPTTQTGDVQVIALAAGKVKVIVYNKANDEVGDTVVMTVKNTPITGFSFTNSVTDMKVGDEDTLKVEILPAEAKNNPVSWRSSDESVVTVNAKGALVAKGRGEATITAATAFDKVLTKVINVTKVAAKEFEFAAKKAEIVIGDEDYVPLKVVLTPTGSTSPSFKVVPKNEIKNGATVEIIAHPALGNIAIAPADVSNTGLAAVVAYNGTKDKDGKLITDTCWISIVDVSDNVVLAKPMYNTVDFGENTVVIAKIVNYSSSNIKLDKAVLTRTDKVIGADGQQEKDAAGKGKVKTVILQTITPALDCNANGGAIQAPFKPITTNTTQIATYNVKYTYTTAEGLENSITRAVTVDNGAVLSPKH